jgi:hypothetical protein
MPKDRKLTYSDRQAQAARDKKQQPKNNKSKEAAPTEKKTGK